MFLLCINNTICKSVLIMPFYFIVLSLVYTSMLRLNLCCIFPFPFQNKFRMMVKIHTNINAMGKCLTPDIADHPTHRFHLKLTALSNLEVHRNFQEERKSHSSRPLSLLYFTEVKYTFFECGFYYHIGILF